MEIFFLCPHLGERLSCTKLIKLNQGRQNKILSIKQNTTEK